MFFVYLGDSTSTGHVDVNIDCAYVNHKFGERVFIKVGCFKQFIGNDLIYDTFDGAQFNAGNDKVQLQATYGYMIEAMYNSSFDGRIEKI